MAGGVLYEVEAGAEGGDSLVTGPFWIHGH